MKRLLLVLAILLATTTPSHADGFWRESGRACVFGATVLGVSAAIMLYPALASGAATVPATTLVVGNTVFGCGLGMIGSMAAFGFGALYDSLDRTEPLPVPAPPPPPKSRNSVT